VSRGAERSTGVRPIPTPLTLASEQIRDARLERARDFGDLPHLSRWPGARELLGPLLPGHMFTVGGRPGRGKSTVLLNLFDMLVESRWPVLYLTTETKAAEMRAVWAALRLGYPKKHVLANAWHLLPAGAKERVTQELDAQEACADIGLFVDLPRLDAAHVRQALAEYALRCQYTIVLLDHIHRWQPQALEHKTAEMTSAVQGLKGAAAKHGLVVILAAQLNRGQDRSPLAEFLPANLSALKQTAALEEESNAVLMLHGARKRDVTVPMIKEVAAGQRQVSDLIEPGLLCATIAKHRDWPDSVGRMLRFRVTHERLDEEHAGGSQLSLGTSDDDDERVPF
jgi:replicative DNA helicase